MYPAIFADAVYPFKASPFSNTIAGFHRPFQHRSFPERCVSGVHSDKSAADICKPRQWHSQQPSCLVYIVLDDGLPVIDSTMGMQCHCDKRRIPFGAIDAASNTDSDSSFAATETMR